MTSLIVCTFNRPQYLNQCFASLLRADLSPLNKIYIIDDHSTDEETKRLINDFDVEGIDVVKIRKGKNVGIKNSLAIGYLLAFEHSDLVINLDGDAICRRDFVSVLLGLKKQFPNNIVSGFNTTVKNRNPIIEEHETYFKKKYASGINMVINKDEYEDYLLPAISMPIGNFDFEASKLHMADGKSVIVAKPSVCQHIGVEESSMGHISQSEPPDVATDFFEDPDYEIRDRNSGHTVIGVSDALFEDNAKDYGTRMIIRKGKYNAVTHARLLLPKITLIAVDDNLEGIIKAADISCQFIEFAAVKLLSCAPSKDKRVIPIRKLGSKKEYSQFLLKEIVDYIDTPYFIVIQADGYILNYEAWTDDFYSVDFVGACWSWYTDLYRCGNGGCSMRSRRLHEITKNDPNIILTNDNIITNYAEDHNLGKIYRKYLEDIHNIKFASDELCNRFSIEAWMRSPEEKKYKGSFGFHGMGLDFSEAQLPHIPYIKK